MKDHSLFDWVSLLGPILLSWPLLISVVLLFFHRPLFSLLDQLSSQNIQKAKIGPFEIEEAEQPYVEAVKLLLTCFISADELNHLRQLDNGEDSVPYESGTDLSVELKRLSGLGFIQARTDLDELPQEGDLNHYIELTEKGKEYLTLYDSFLANQSSSAEKEEV